MDIYKFKKLSAVEAESEFSSTESTHLIVEDGGGGIRRLDAENKLLPTPTQEDVGKVPVVQESGTYNLNDMGVTPDAIVTATGDMTSEQKAQTRENIGAGKPLIYDNVAQMIADTTLTNGEKVSTLGYYLPNDGGGANYIIRAKTNTDVDNGGSIIFLANNNVAENALIKDCGYIDIRWFGAVPDGETDCSEILQKCINLSNDKYLTPIKIIGDFYVGQEISFIGSLCLEGIAPPSRIVLTNNNRPDTTVSYISTIRFAAGITGFNIIGLGSTSEAGSRQTELFIKNIEFIGTNTTKLFVLDSFGAPSRVSYIKECKIHSFHTMLEAILGNGYQYGTLIAQFDICNNSIYSIVNVFNVIGSSTGPTFSGLNIHDNTIEWCQGMVMRDVDGYCAIVNNLMEGWHGDIDITIGKGTFDFIGNGFEGNTGKISIQGTNPGLSVLNIDKLFFSDSNPQDFTFEFSLLTIQSLGCNTNNIKFIGDCKFGIDALKMLSKLPVSCFAYNKQFIVPYMPKTVSTDVIAKQSTSIETTKDRVKIYQSAASDITLSPSDGTWATTMAITTDEVYVVSCYYPEGNTNTLLQYAGYDNARTCGLDFSLNFGPGYRFIVFKATKTENKGRIYIAKRENANCEIGAVTFLHVDSDNDKISKYFAAEDNNAAFM